MTETTYHFPVPGTVAVIADLHDRPYFSIIQSLSDRRPEIICMTGDLVFGGKPDNNHLLIRTQKYVLPFLRACRRIAPIFLSLGNHERAVADADLQLIRDTGCIVLDNEWTVREGVVIGGLTSHYVLDYRRFRQGKQDLYPKCRHKPRIIKEPKTEWLADFEKQAGYKILLCHHPEYYPLYLKNWNIDLILAGHAHGGQWRIGKQGIYAPGQGLFPRLTSGIHDGRLAISRGLSNQTPIPRLNNPTEIIYIERQD